jgi:hypothetical protein
MSNPTDMSTKLYRSGPEENLKAAAMTGTTTISVPKKSRTGKNPDQVVHK